MRVLTLPTMLTRASSTRMRMPSTCTRMLSQFTRTPSTFTHAPATHLATCQRHAGQRRLACRCRRRTQLSSSLLPPLTMVRSGSEVVATTSNAKHKDADGASSSLPSSPTFESASMSSTTTTLEVCSPEHAFYAFNALYCALIPYSKPVEPLFVDDK
jgi:hypothetical protein